jgi:hypothetical protein
MMRRRIVVHLLIFARLTISRYETIRSLDVAAAVAAAVAAIKIN